MALIIIDVLNPDSEDERKKTPITKEETPKRDRRLVIRKQVINIHGEIVDAPA